VRLLLIRHAESEGNAAGRFQGQRDYPLSPRGVEQAARLAERLKARPLDHIYASPLTRASHTARLLAEIKGMTVLPLPGVMEYDFGELSGLSWAEIEQRHPELAAAQRARGRSYVPWPGEEGREIFRERVCRALWALEENHGSETVAVFSHGGAIAVFCQSVLGLNGELRAPFMVENTAIFEIEVRDGRGTIWTTNDTCHLHDD
jgi:broad specificity phosphatase PhoE